ncbi:prohead protease [Asticcacaulis sp. AC466]|uniref:S49 family peptidase n=1 Tax=Asticcacaulis sp. AC466 TaxID=1282362 RepID=UPI0003C3ECAD|nr:S49 family peptidase [Asticcacaulis sp. AC466]ESQ85500.1 prohead protease [Asticcacaulis sp. AC466]
MTNRYVAAFQDHQPAIISASGRAQFEMCMTRLAAALPEIEEKMAARADDSDWWGADDDRWMRFIRPYVVKDGVLQIPVKGVLLHDFPYQFSSYATGYDYIWRAFERGMGDLNVKGIALVVDSPGGMVAGCFEMVDKMFAMRGKKPIEGFASESAYSAAYATISVADRITVTRTGGVGSIGVVTSHVDISQMMKEFGWVVTFIYAGKHKVDGNAYEALSDDVKARIQARINDLYGIFVQTVARNRGLDEKAVRDTEALTYGAPESLSVGLADAIGAFDDALADFTASLNLNEGDETMADITQAQLDEAVATARADGVTAGKAEGHAAGLKEGATAERTRINGILATDVAKARPKAALSTALKTDMSVEAATAFLADFDEEKPVATADEKPAGAGAPAGMMESAMSNSENPNVGTGGGGDENASSLSDPKSILALASAVGLKGYATKK